MSVIDKTGVIGKGSAQPMVNQKFEDKSISSTSDIKSDATIAAPQPKGMNPILKYSLMGIGGALVIFLGYRMIFKRK